MIRRSIYVAFLYALTAGLVSSQEGVAEHRADAFAEQADAAWRKMDYRLAYALALDALESDKNHLQANVIAARFAILEMLGPQEWGKTLERAEGDVLRYVESRGDEAIERLLRVIAMDPHYKPARLLLGLAYYENDMFHRLVALFEDYRRQSPEDPEPYFMLALALTTLGDDDHAQIAFTHGLNRLTEGSPYLRAGFLLHRVDSGGTAIDLKQTWASEDPLRMTPANERLMEHYRRVAYANLRFSEDAEMKQGADSDRGRIYIRYGAPVERFITTSTVGPDQLWSYEDFSVSFMRLRGRPWQYRNGLREKKEYRTIARLEAVFPPSSKEAERWQRIPLMCRPVQFRGENGRTRLDLHVSVREHQVQSGKGPKGARRVHLEHGILAMQDWKVVESAIQNVDYLAWIKGTKEGGYLLRSDYLTVDAGVYQVMIESLDDDAGFLGTYLDTVEVRSFEGTGLALSDLAINRRSVTRPGGKGRKGTVFLSAPEGTGVRGKTLEVFAEVYNLAVYTKPDSTRYSTSFSVRSEGEAEEWTVVSSEQHRGDARWEPITLKLDLAVSAPGPKQLRLRLTDHARSETIETTAPFRVVW